MNSRNILRTAVAAMLTLAVATFARADESLDLYASHTDDGGCAEPAMLVEMRYALGGGPLTTEASARVAPSAGNCLERAVAYDVSVQRDVPIGAGFDLVFRAQAAEDAASAVYELLDEGGSVLTRADGGALFAPTLPAGAARVVGAQAGIGRTTPIGRLRIAYNAVPTPWTMAEESTTVHMGWDSVVGNWTFGAEADVGEDDFGNAYLAWSRGVATCRAEYRWGIAAIDTGAPALQHVDGAPFRLAAAPRNDSSRIGCGIRLPL